MIKGVGVDNVDIPRLNKVYEKKGHEFIDVFVNLFDESDEACVMTINLIAIYKLRGSS